MAFAEWRRPFFVYNLPLCGPQYTRLPDFTALNYAFWFFLASNKPLNFF